LARLEQAGHAVTNENRFAPSMQVLAWYDSITTGKSRTAVHKDLQRVEKFLGICSSA
jgi:hypothetical protein